MDRKLRIEGKEVNPDCQPWLDATKRPVTVQVVQFNAPFTVETLEGTMQGYAGDFLIRGVKGELYPCKPDIFRETYEPPEGMFWCERCVKLYPREDLHMGAEAEYCLSCWEEISKIVYCQICGTKERLDNQGNYPEGWGEIDDGGFYVLVCPKCVSVF